MNSSILTSKVMLVLHGSLVLVFTYNRDRIIAVCKHVQPVLLLERKIIDGDRKEKNRKAEEEGSCPSE